MRGRGFSFAWGLELDRLAGVEAGGGEGRSGAALVGGKRRAVRAEFGRRDGARHELVPFAEQAVAFRAEGDGFFLVVGKLDEKFAGAADVVLGPAQVAALVEDRHV